MKTRLLQFTRKARQRFARIESKTPNGQVRRVSGRARLGFEALEQRAMLAADPGWAFALGGPSYLSDSVVEVGPDDCVYVAGGFEGTVDFDPGPGTAQLTAPLGAQDGFVAKYTLQGEFVWVNRVSGAGLEECRGLDFDAAGNLYLVGNYDSSIATLDGIQLANHGSFDTFAARMDAATGAFVWAASVGGPLLEASQMVEVSATGDVYLTGYFRETVDFDPSPGGTFELTAASAGFADAFVLKLDSSGNFFWVRQFTGPFDDFGHCVALDGAGSIYAVGTFRDTTDFGESGNPLLLTAPTSVEPNVYILKMEEATGNSVWARHASGPEQINAGRVVADGMGNVYVAGGFRGTVNFGPGTPTLVSSGGADAFVSKWDATGNLVWAEALASGTSDAVPQELQLDHAANLLIGVHFQGAADF
jgi:hypothetical protein